MPTCPMCKGIRFVMTTFGQKPCPECGGSGEVAGGSCDTCCHKGNVLEQFWNKSLLGLNDVYCKAAKRTVKPEEQSNCYSLEGK